VSEAPTINWFGLSGREYKYWIYKIGKTFKEDPGNYIFAKETQTGYWSPSYIGETENLNQRLGNHEKEACARKHGATHIHAHLNSGGEEARRQEENDLIMKWKPPCNE